jgi:hypothetical protein
VHASKNDKPRQKAGVCETLLDRAGKRVRRFELSAFTLATGMFLGNSAFFVDASNGIERISEVFSFQERLQQ